jgi:hypothetical protein
MADSSSLQERNPGFEAAAKPGLAQYRDARARGHNHQRAIRTLGRAWCRVLWRSWQDCIPYDPSRHRALQTQLAVYAHTTQIATLPADLTPHPIAGARCAPA